MKTSSDLKHGVNLSNFDACDFKAVKAVRCRCHSEILHLSQALQLHALWSQRCAAAPSSTYSGAVATASEKKHRRKHDRKYSIVGSTPENRLVAFDQGITKLRSPWFTCLLCLLSLSQVFFGAGEKRSIRWKIWQLTLRGLVFVNKPIFHNHTQHDWWWYYMHIQNI